MFSGGATQYASGYCDAGIAVTAPDACIVGRQVERLLETFWRSPVHAVKRQQDPEGLLCATLSYAHERMGSLADVCAICDAPLAFGEASILPSVCGRPLCAHQLETFGKLLVGATCLAARADVLDLLVATTRLAARSRRAADILQPSVRGVVINQGVRLSSVAWNQSVDRTQAQRPRRHERRRGRRGQDFGPLPLLRENPRGGAERRPIGRRLRGRRGRVAQGR